MLWFFRKQSDYIIKVPKHLLKTNKNESPEGNRAFKFNSHGSPSENVLKFFPNYKTINHNH
ncbi:MAG: hypothetical protein CMN32_11035 [Saprospirales bacterium]|jgi:hypothetical protein|nr:hypothetical protein [Saprospirales bacterium]